MSDFVKWFSEKQVACQPMIDWLNENATHLSNEWHLWHSGGGCTHYRAEGEFEGRRCEFLLCHESTAEPEPVQDDPLWMLTANERDVDGEDLAFAILAENQHDMREAVALSREKVLAPDEWKPF